IFCFCKLGFVVKKLGRGLMSELAKKFAPIPFVEFEISPLEDCYVESLSLKESDQQYNTTTINLKMQNDTTSCVQNDTSYVKGWIRPLI
ncbi:MAG: hypothetical protein K2J63_11960, partial [Muribaculaceae bacterium]|nr:hypothetical protein [Muribaculaceae bacterium]